MIFIKFDLAPAAPTVVPTVAPTVAPTAGPAVGASLNERRLALVERRWQLQRDVRELAKASQVVDQVRYGSHLWLTLWPTPKIHTDTHRWLLMSLCRGSASF